LRIVIPQKAGGIYYTCLRLDENHMQSLLIFFSFPLHYAFIFLLKHFQCALSRLLGVASVKPQPWVHRGWSSQKLTKWCQCTAVQLQGSDGGIIAVDLEKAKPEERTRSLPSLELNTVMERAYIISYFSAGPKVSLQFGTKILVLATRHVYNKM